MFIWVSLCYPTIWIFRVSCLALLFLSCILVACLYNKRRSPCKWKHVSQTHSTYFICQPVEHCSLIWLREGLIQLIHGCLCRWGYCTFRLLTSKDQALSSDHKKHRYDCLHPLSESTNATKERHRTGIWADGTSLRDIYVLLNRPGFPIFGGDAWRWNKEPTDGMTTQWN